MYVLFKLCTHLQINMNLVVKNAICFCNFHIYIYLEMSNHFSYNTNKFGNQN